MFVFSPCLTRSHIEIELKIKCLSGAAEQSSCFGSPFLQLADVDLLEAGSGTRNCFYCRPGPKDFVPIMLEDCFTDVQHFPKQLVLSESLRIPC